MKHTLSRRQYARHRGVSVRAVQKRIETGALDAAIMADGRIDSDIADALLSENTTAGPASSSGSLIEARRRKEAAACALLADEVADFEASLIPRTIADETTRRLSLFVAKQFLGMVDTIATGAAGKKATIALPIIDQIVFDTLTAVSEMEVISEGGPMAAPPVPAFGTMTLIELVAARTNLQARKLELRRAQRSGVMVDLGHLSDTSYGRAITARSLILGLPSKLVPLLEHADLASARTLVAREVDQIIGNLACDAVSLNELLAAK